MKLLVYSPVSVGERTKSLGLPEYSYTFVVERFLPVLRELGDVVVVTDPAREADPLFRAARAEGQDCLLLSFAPPHRAPIGLECPTVTVVAWEFDSIPTDVWSDNRQDDWRVALADHGSAISLSRQARDVIADEMGPDFHVVAIPAPIHDRFAVGDAERTIDLTERRLTYSGLNIDNRCFTGAETTLVPGSRLATYEEQPWSRKPLHLGFTDRDAARGRLVGFYRPEPWGAWSRMDTPWVLLPSTVSGRVRLTFSAAGYGLNADRTVSVRIGDCVRSFHLTGAFETHTLDFTVERAANTVEFSGLSVTQLAESADPRSMALGLCWMRLQRRGPIPPIPVVERVRTRIQQRRRSDDAEAPLPLPLEDETLSVDGVVYTTVLNPADGRKNWKSIVTAFCWAFRDNPAATLVIKMTHKSMTSYFADLQFQLHRVGPVQCRVVAMHGFLTDDQLGELTRLSTYYVNASEAEGLCMPLMEFMSAGVPAIAPDHTAMADYIDADSAFIVESSEFPTIWPQDPRQLWRAHKNRVHWDSLVAAYEESFRVATENPRRYVEMSRAAAAGQQRFCGDGVVRAALAEALEGAGR